MTQTSPFKLGSAYEVIKNGCYLPKKFSYQNVPKLILGKVIKCQKGLMKNKKIGRQKIEKSGLLEPSRPLPMEL